MSGLGPCEVCGAPATGISNDLAPGKPAIFDGKKWATWRVKKTHHLCAEHMPPDFRRFLANVESIGFSSAARTLGREESLR